MHGESKCAERRATTRYDQNGFIVDYPHKLPVRILEKVYMSNGGDKPNWIMDCHGYVGKARGLVL